MSDPTPSKPDMSQWAARLRQLFSSNGQGPSASQVTADPVYVPALSGILYPQQGYASSWKYQTTAPVTAKGSSTPTPPAAYRGLDVLGTDDHHDGYNIEDADSDSDDWEDFYDEEDEAVVKAPVMNLNELVESIDKLGDTDPVLADVMTRFDGDYERDEVRIGDKEDPEEPDLFIVDPPQAVADVIQQAFFEGTTWTETQGTRAQIPLKKSVFTLPKYAKKKYGVEVLGDIPHTLIGKRAQKIVSKADMKKILRCKESCCDKKCLKTWRRCQKGKDCKMVLETHRFATASMNETARQHHFINIIKDHLVAKMAVASNGEGKVITGYDVSPYKVKVDVELCQNAYAKIHGVSVRTFQRYTKWARDGVTGKPKGRKPGTSTAKSQAARCWLMHYASLHDKMPNSSVNGVTKVVVDVPRKCDVWYAYAMFMLRAGYQRQEILAYKSFAKMWCNDFPWLKVRKAKTIESKCLVCEDLENLIARYSSIDTGVVSALRLLQYDHILFQMAEREIYYKRRIWAENYPTEVACIIIDGMQQATTAIPRKRKYKYDQDRLEQKLVGVLAHGPNRQHLYAYRCLPHLEGGANLTITCLWRTICSMIEEGCFPRDKTLYLQIDGGSENVNRVMPQFACWLCQNKICNTVVISRLPVGHTHEDIDQKFSVISRRLKATDIMTPQEFERAVRSAFSDIRHENAVKKLVCVFSDVWAVWDFRKWFESHPMAWPGQIGNWSKRDKAVLSWRVSRSTCTPSITQRIYIQTRLFSAPKVRRVITRDPDTDHKLSFPELKDDLIVWEPNDSVHGGKLYLQEVLGGFPDYSEFRPTGESHPEWEIKLRTVWRQLKRNYFTSNCFDEDRVDEWERFMKDYPWGGLQDVPQDRLPVFRLPVFPDRLAMVTGGEDWTKGVLEQAGIDQHGRLRPFFKGGKDVMKYGRAQSFVTYGDILLNGKRHIPAKRRRADDDVGLHREQFVAVPTDALHLATNLISRVGGGVEVVRSSCEGWWLGRVVLVIRQDGKEDPQAKTFAEVSAERRATADARAKKRKADAKEAKKKDKAQKNSDIEEEEEEDDDEEKANSRIHKARVEWYGNIDSAGAVSCKGGQPMLSLEIKDDIPRVHLAYEEADLNHIRFNKDGRLAKTSLNHIVASIPPVLASWSTANGSGEGQQGPSKGYNHAGEYVGGDQKPRGPEEEARWEVAAEEVCGFEWTPRKDLVNDDPPTYRVYGIRRAHGQVYAMVLTSQEDVQQDHPIMEIRRRIFFAAVADRVRFRLPFMMQWPRLKDGTLVLGNDIILANANYYGAIVSKTPAIPQKGELPRSDIRAFAVLGHVKELLLREELHAMFDEDPESPGKGCYISDEPIQLFILMLLRRLVMRRDGASTTLIGAIWSFCPSFRVDYADDKIANPKTEETYRARTLRQLLRINGGSVKGRETERLTSSDYIQEIHRRFHRILLTHNVNDNHFVVIEVVLQSSRGRYIKVWDGMKTWGQGVNPKELPPQLDVIVEVFFRGHPVDVHLWEEGDPVQATGHGCGPFAVLILSYLTRGLRPPAWTSRDEAVARHYLWGCLLKGVILPPPKQRL